MSTLLNTREVWKTFTKPAVKEQSTQSAPAQCRCYFLYPQNPVMSHASNPINPKEILPDPSKLPMNDHCHSLFEHYNHEHGGKKE